MIVPFHAMRRFSDSLRDFTDDRQWLADHRDEYAGQWVALKFGRLVSHGKNAKEVHQTAIDAGLVLRRSG
jgi:hypothetical protein